MFKKFHLRPGPWPAVGSALQFFLHVLILAVGFCDFVSFAHVLAVLALVSFDDRHDIPCSWGVLLCFQWHAS